MTKTGRVHITPDAQPHSTAHHAAEYRIMLHTLTNIYKTQDNVPHGTTSSGNEPLV